MSAVVQVQKFPVAVVDAGNSTNAPLLAGASFQGTAVDLLGFYSISYSIHADQISATDGIELQFSPDNNFWDTRFVVTYGANRVNKTSDLVFRPHDRYFRIKYTNGGTNQTEFRLQVLLNPYPPAGDTIGVDNAPSSGDDAILVKSVMTGKVLGSTLPYRDVLVDTNGALLVKEAGFRGAFGSILTATETVRANMQFQYNINSRIVNATVANSGTVTQSNGRAVLATSTNSASSAKIESREVLKYTPGQGCIARFTAIFATGTANNRQEIGIGDDLDGFFFGYDGTQFGVCRRQNGTDTWIAQTAWNGDDQFLGAGLTGTTINPQNGNVYQIQYQWLGFGAIRFFIEDPATGEYVLVHTIKYPNTATTPSIFNPTLPLHAKIINTGNTTILQLMTASMGGIVEGPPVVNGSWIHNSRSVNKTGIPTTGTAMLSIRDKVTVFGGTAGNNRVSVVLDSISIRAASANDLYVELRLNPTLTTPSFTDINANTSVVDFDTAGAYTGGSGELLYTISVAGGTADQVPLTDTTIRIRPGDVLTAVCYSEAATVTARVALNWHEEF